MTAKLVEIARFDDLFRAETVRIGLEELGIPAFVEGAETNRAMHYVGTALGGIRVLVPADKKVEAETAIAQIEYQNSNAPSPAWVCPNCGEEVEGNFESCWSCHTERPANPKLAPLRADEHEVEDDDDAEPIPARDDEANPYSAPRTTKPISEVASGMDAAQVEAVVLRAWRASVIGLFFCPVLLHAYSMFVLIDTRDAVSLLSETGKRRRFWAVVINVLMLLAGLVFIAVNVLSMRPRY